MEESYDSPEGEEPFSEPIGEAGSDSVAVADGEESTPPEDAEGEGEERPTAAEGPPEPRPRRSLKVVLTLQPQNDTGYQAVLALGADGCDPILRSIEVADLAGAWAELPALLAEAEDRWENQPRYPAAAPAKTTRVAPARAAAKPETAPAEGGPSSPAPASESTPSDQLALFG
jgi:hypothetical protein